MTPEFLTVTDVLEIHLDQIQHYGGRTGVRDAGLLESAVAMPRAMFGGRFVHDDLFKMAAAYLFHIVSNHPFVDGNKRAGAASALVFLALNDVEVKADEDGLYELTLAIAKGQAGKEELADFFRKIAR